jgi:hypothetical protein
VKFLVQFALRTALVSAVHAGCVFGEPTHLSPDTSADDSHVSETTPNDTIDSDICWSEQVYCLHTCPDGSRCDFPGVCVPDEVPEPDLVAFRDPAQGRDLRTLLAPDGRFANPIGVIDDLRWGQVNPVRGTELFKRIYSDFDWFDRPGALRRMYLGNVALDPDSPYNVGAAGSVYDAYVSGDSILYMHYLRRGEIPPIVFEVIEGDRTTVRTWRAEFVSEPGEDVRRGLNLAHRTPVEVRPWLGLDGQPELLGEWTFTELDSEFAVPADAYVLAWSRLSVPLSDTAALTQEPPARVHYFEMQQVTISRDWEVVGNSVRSIDRRLPVRVGGYQHLGDPQVEASGDPYYGIASLGGLTVTAAFNYSEVFRALLTPTGECSCVRAPDAVDISDDETRIVTPVWNTTSEPPLNGCSRAAQVACAPRLQRTDEVSFDSGYAFTCDRRNDYTTFVRLVRVVPAQSLPALEW